MNVQSFSPGMMIRTAPRTGHGALVSLRWLILGAAMLALVCVSLGRAGAVGAAAPTAYPTVWAPPATVATAPYANVPVFVNGNTTGISYPANTVISTYFDPRYGEVSVVTDAGGNLIDVNAATGQRIIPIYPDYGYAAGYVSGSAVIPTYGGYVNPYFSGGLVG